MQNSRFDSLNATIRKRRRWIIIGWAALALISVSFLPSFFSHVSYNITDGFSGPSNTESQKAESIVKAAFPSTNGNASSNAILVLLQGANPYSNSVKDTVLSLNKTLADDQQISNYTGMSSVYSTEFGLLNSSLPSMIPQVAALEASIPSTNLTFTQKWHVASSIVANSTEVAFSSSPLFRVNSTSLTNLLSALPESPSPSQIDSAVNGVISNQSFLNYPFVPTDAITGNFVSKDNQSMIVVLNFSSEPGAGTIAQVQSSVKNSGLENLGTVYVTGSPVITQDVQNVFTPALGVTIGPGVGIAILIVGLLFFSPIAALIPVLMGGLSIAIALPAIYFGIVVIGRGSVTFLTPTLTTLLMLGLAVDYAVLQLRRTREERLNGKSIDESVGISVRWAGQAVLTAGITVIVAYIVMAVANVPLFSSVGTAIALGVTILLAASLTLLPALELSLGDRIFWPWRPVGKSKPMKSRLRRITEVTLRRKVAISAVVSLFALGAFYTSYHTPVGEDFLKLIPNFPSNQGLTAITNAFGGGQITPTQIVVVTPTAITYGNNQFNQTLLNEIEQISNVAANSSGVVSVTGPTRPYGSLFNYSSIGSMPAALRSQYQSGMLALVGKDNKTVVINVGLSNPSQSQAAINSLLGMEKSIGKLTLSNGIAIYFGGSTQQTYDSQSFLVGLLPEVVIILAVAVYAILFFQLRSAFTPLRLILTILSSVVFSLALLSIAFYHIQGLPILDFAPLFVVVTMLGVGIDYDIFFVTRIREEVLGGKSDNAAITTAVEKIWVTILGLGLVLAAVFSSLLITGIAILQEIGAAVAGAIVLDVLVIILFFVPSLMGLAQEFNWWPSKIGRQNREETRSK
ncbi:MAG: MMPL family transporter [Nitrososphaerales archaeon]